MSSYCDIRVHKGTIYRSAGMRLSRVNESGIETWWTPDVSPLTAEQDGEIRDRAKWSGRSQRVRESRRSLFDGVIT